MSGNWNYPNSCLLKFVTWCWHRNLVQIKARNYKGKWYSFKSANLIARSASEMILSREISIGRSDKVQSKKNADFTKGDWSLCYLKLGSSHLLFLSSILGLI